MLLKKQKKACNPPKQYTYSADHKIYINRGFFKKVSKQKYTMSTRQHQQHSISKFFIRIILFKFHVMSQVSKHCSIFRIISVVFIIAYASIEETYRSRKTHQRVLFLLFWSSKIYKNVPLTYQRSHFGNIT